jgi:hypothetical protein
MQIIHVEMDDIEFVNALHYVFKHHVMMSELIVASLVQAQRRRASRYESCGGLRVAAGEQCNFVPHLD